MKSGIADMINSALQSPEARSVVVQLCGLGSIMVKIGQIRGQRCTIYNLETDPNWTKIQDPDPNSMYLLFGSTPLLWSQHSWFCQFYLRGQMAHREAAVKIRDKASTYLARNRRLRNAQVGTVWPRNYLARNMRLRMYCLTSLKLRPVAFSISPSLAIENRQFRALNI